MICHKNPTNQPVSFSSSPFLHPPLSLSLCIYLFILFFSFLHFLFLKSQVFAHGPGDRGSVLARVIPKTQKMILDAALLSTQQYKVSINGKVEQSREGIAPSPTPW